MLRPQTHPTNKAEAAQLWTGMGVKSVCSDLLWATRLWIFDVHGSPRVRACVPLIALVTQAVSHSHRSKLWVGEGHCGADGGDRGGTETEGGRRQRETGGRDGGWVGEKENEGDDNEKLKFSEGKEM